MSPALRLPSLTGGRAAGGWSVVAGSRELACFCRVGDGDGEGLGPSVARLVRLPARLKRKLPVEPLEDRLGEPSFKALASVDDEPAFLGESLLKRSTGVLVASPK